jgi:flagellar hook assembly protein FlgD
MRLVPENRMLRPLGEQHYHDSACKLRLTNRLTELNLASGSTMRKNLFYMICSCLLLLLGSTTVRSQGNLISHVDIDEFTISPDGDGIQDSLVITYILEDTAFSVSAFIMSSDSPQVVVDTLLIGIAQSAGTYSLSWKGTNSSGSMVAEGKYKALLHAFNSTYDDSVTEIVYVDLTAPIVAITRHEPGIFAPGADSPMFSVFFNVDDSPAENLDEIEISVRDPNGSLVTDLSPDPPFAGSGSYSASWDGDGASQDGIYQIDITIRDFAGYRASDWANINVDMKSPGLKITSLEDDLTVKASPDSLFGWTWDRNGINPDSLRFSTNDTLYEEITSRFLQADTLRIGIALASLVTQEGKYTLFFKSQDIVGRESKISFRVTIDSTPPPPPILFEPPEHTVRSPIYTLTGTTPGGAQTVKIIRNNELIDSVASSPDENFSYKVSLEVGSNAFKVFTVDEAGNQSSFSNTIEVIFDSAAGLFIPQPFHPNDVFQINLSREANSVRLRLYDLSGNLVNVIDKTTSGTSISISWNGLNGDGETPARGPLVAAAEIRYSTGGKETMREIFLFKP